MSLQLESLPNMVAGVCSEDNQMQLEATTQFRKLLSIGIDMMNSTLVVFWHVKLMNEISL